MLLAGLVVRVVYVLVQPGTDPAFARPMLDGDYYVGWASSLAAGQGGPGGAYYLAPLYPWGLAAFFKVFGGNIGLLYVIQQTMIVGAAGLLALAARNLAGERAAWCAAFALLAYHPALYFASRPIGESTAIVLFFLALYLLTKPGTRWAAAGGIVLGLATLARPNLLLVALAWGVAEMIASRRIRALAIVAGTVLVLLPVTARNLAVSGHLVPVSSNAGITLYHGNGPGAKGIGILPPEFSGRLSDQRAEATAVARLRSGLDLDDVEADRWWGKQARQVRLEDPAGTVRLLARRIALTAASTEISLDYAPSIDANPWRWTAPLPYGVVLGLAVVGLWAVGWRRTGGSVVWLAIAACAVAPVMFYVSSRYRLPMAVLLCLPAGAGLAALLDVDQKWGRRSVSLALLVAVAGVSFLVPTAGVVATSEATALANRAVSWKEIGDLQAAERDLGRALERDPGSAVAHFGLGVVLEAAGRTDEAAESYRAANNRGRGHADAAGNLGRLLIIGGRSAEAVPLLRAAIALRPHHVPCWTNLIAALHLTGDDSGAASAAAAALGVEIDPELLEFLKFTGRTSSGETVPEGAGSGEGEHEHE